MVVGVIVGVIFSVSVGRVMVGCEGKGGSIVGYDHSNSDRSVESHLFDNPWVRPLSI